MIRGISLFKVLGIRISIDFTWFIAFILFAWSLAYGYFPSEVPGLKKSTYLVMGAISSLFIFVSVLIHELAHSYTSNRLGLRIKEITLFIFGGVAHLTREPDDAMTEFKIAVAGPAASAVLAVVFTILKKVVGGAVDAPALVGVIGFLAMLNMVLLVFNLIPGFPLDGGRVLRALWWARTGDIKTATSVASGIGKSFALFLIFMGFLQMLSGYFIQGLWALLIGLFLQQAAESSYRQLMVKMALEGLRVKDMMTRDVVTVREDQLLSEVVEDYFFTHHFTSFPVVSNGTVVGLLTLNDVRRIGKDRWHDTTVGEAMERFTPEMVLHPNDSAQHALTKMVTEGVGRYLVVDDTGRLIGILSRRDIMKTMELKKTLSG